MRAQLEHLLTQTQLPNVNLRVLPNDLGAHAGFNGAFAILRFGEAGGDQTVYVESPAGNHYMEKPRDVRQFTQTMDHLLSDALGATPSQALLRQIIKEM